MLSDCSGTIDRSQVTILALFDASAAYYRSTTTSFFSASPSPSGFLVHFFNELNSSSADLIVALSFMRVFHGSGLSNLSGFTGSFALFAGGPALASLSPAHLFPDFFLGLEVPLRGGARAPAGACFVLQNSWNGP